MPLHVIRKRGYRNVKGSALITGASSGLGRELARLFAEQCERIYVTARSCDALEALKSELKGKCEIIPIQVDFENRDAANEIRRAIPEKNLDMLVNNAGHHVYGSLLAVDLEEIKKTMEVNFFNPVTLVTLFRDTPTIVNVISTTAVAGRKDLGVYSSTKAALWCFSKALRRTKGRSTHVVDVIPATFESSLASKGYKLPSETEKTDEKRLLSSKRDGLTALAVAKSVKNGIDRKLDVVYIPAFKARLFVLLEAILPGYFRKLFR